MRTTSASEFSAAITDLTNFDFGPAASDPDWQAPSLPEQGRDDLAGILGPDSLNHADHASLADEPISAGTAHDELSGDGTSLDTALSPSGDSIAQFGTSNDGLWINDNAGRG